MSIEDELWEYTIDSLREDYREWRNPGPNVVVCEPLQSSEGRAAAYLTAISELPATLRDMGLHDKVAVLTSHVTLTLHEWRRSGRKDLRLNIGLRNVDDSVVYCISLEIVGRDLVEGIPWTLTALSRLEDFPQVFRIMMQKLVSGDPFGLTANQM